MNAEPSIHDEDRVFTRRLASSLHPTRYRSTQALASLTKEETENMEGMGEVVEEMPSTHQVMSIYSPGGGVEMTRLPLLDTTP